MKRKEIEVAMQRCFDGELPEWELSELRNLLKKDSRARNIYYEYARLFGALDLHCCGSKSLNVAQTVVAARLNKQKQRSVRLTAIFSLATCIIIALILHQILVPSAPTAFIKHSVASIYSVSYDDLEREIHLDRVEVGSTVDLSQGTLELTFRNGSRALFLAPSHFKVQSESRVELNKGIVWVEVKPEDVGFQVLTPRLLVTDLGTEFGVSSGIDSQEEVHVFSGKVEVRNEESDQVRTLTRGQALRVTKENEFEMIKSRAGNFIRNLAPNKAGELIGNGNFEKGNLPPDSRFGVPASAAILPSWNFKSDRVRVSYKTERGLLGYGWDRESIVSSSKDVQLSFMGSDTSDHVIWQTFETEPRTKYEVRFEMGGILRTQKKDHLVLTATVYDGRGESGSAGHILGQLTDDRLSRDGQGFNDFVSFEFIALSHASTLVFRETSQSSRSADPSLDNVTVRKAD